MVKCGVLWVQVRRTEYTRRDEVQETGWRAEQTDLQGKEKQVQNGYKTKGNW